MSETSPVAMTPGNEVDGDAADGVLQVSMSEACSGMRLDAALARQLPDFSRSKIQKLIADGQVRVDGADPSQRLRVRGGEVVTLVIPEPEVCECQAEAMDLHIEYEDSDLLVLAKPAGLVVHPGAGNPGGTLMNGLLHHDPSLFALPRAGIVHRLDKDTSGLMVVAKTESTRQALIEMIKTRAVSRIYQTLVQGRPGSTGTIDAPIGRHSHNRLKMAVIQRGRPAVSHFRVLESFTGYTLCEVRLETGRTHQIRVHMAHIGHPVVGDPLYAGRPRPPSGMPEALRREVLGFGRQALHAWRLNFDHPRSGQLLAFESDPPQDFAMLLQKLRETQKKTAP